MSSIVASEKTDIAEPHFIVAARKAALVIFVVFGVGTLLAIFLQSYVPSPQGLALGLYCGIASGLIGAIFGMLPVKPGAKIKDWLRPRAVRIPFTTAMFLILGYLTFTSGLPALFTKFWGSPGERQVRISYWSGGRKACKGVQISDTFLSGHVCLDGALEKKLPSGTLITIAGRTSHFGMSVESVR